MSDQSTTLGNTQYVGAGGAGITTVNGDDTPAQVLAVGAGVSLVNVGPLHTFANTGVLSVQRVSLPARTGAITLSYDGTMSIAESPAGTFVFSVPSGTRVVSFGLAGLPRYDAIVIAAGTGITIVEGPNGTYTWNVTATAGVSSFGLSGTPRTGAIVIAGSASVTVTESPVGTFTFTSASGTGLVSINTDGTPAQTITATLPVVITNPGAGAHGISVNDFSGTARGTVPNPTGFSSHAYLSPGGWVDTQYQASSDPYPGNGQVLYNGFDSVVQTLVAPQTGYILVIGHASSTLPASSGVGSAVSLTIRVAGVPQATVTFPINTAVPSYHEVSVVTHVTFGQVVDLVFNNQSGQNLITQGSNLTLSTAY